MLTSATSPVVLSIDARKPASWLQVLSHLDPQFGGIACSVPPFSRATQSASRYACPIASFCSRDEFQYLPLKQRVQGSCFPSDRARWLFDMGLRQRLREAIRKADGVHIHGIWEAHCSVTASIARSCHRPYIISAHGMLDRWALGHKRIKKALYAALIETANLKSVACLRALTREEANDYRRIGLPGPIAIVPSGVDLSEGLDEQLFWQAYPNLCGRRLVLFLGRLHRKKGVHLLLQAWARIARAFSDLHLVIAGPDEDNLRAPLELMVYDLKLQDSVTFTGMLSKERKASALAASSLFVLPSYSEGFSIAVLEALAAGLPMIVSHPCHIPEVSEAGCGWVIEPESTALERALEEFARTPGSGLRKMSERARNLVEQRFCWPVVGRQMAEVYDWVLGGQKPANVEVL